MYKSVDSCSEYWLLSLFSYISYHTSYHISYHYFWYLIILLSGHILVIMLQSLWSTYLISQLSSGSCNNANSSNRGWIQPAVPVIQNPMINIITLPTSDTYVWQWLQRCLGRTEISINTARLVSSWGRPLVCCSICWHKAGF